MLFNPRWFMVPWVLGLLISISPLLPAQGSKKAPRADAKTADAKGDGQKSEAKKEEKRDEKGSEDDAKGEAAPAEETAKSPEALLAQPSLYWVLDFQPVRLRMISPKDGLGAGKVYWYLVYTLGNSGKEDRSCFVNITAVSDNNKQYSDLYLPSVERAIERKEGQPLWGKTDEYEIVSKRKPDDPKYNYIPLKAGEKRSCVAVFNRLDPNANKITISVSGLSNEIRYVPKEDGTKELEERVRELYFERPGDEYAITADSFKAVGKEWVRKKTQLADSKQPSGR
jgi:hypothetical protein